MSTAISTGITMLLVGLMLGYVRSRNQAVAASLDPSAPAVLRLPYFYVVVGVIGTAFFSAGAFFGGLTGTPWNPSWSQAEPPLAAALICSCFLAFAAGSFLLIAAWRWETIEVDERGCRGRDGLLRRFELPWSDIVLVRGNASMRWLRLDRRDGPPVRVVFDMIGMPAFVAHLRAQVPSERMAGASVHLDALARGVV